MESKLMPGLLVALIFGVFLTALSFRYRMVEAASHAYVIDNWTGRMWVCRAACIRVQDQ